MSRRNRTSCRLCDRLVISQAVTFVGGTLIINLPPCCFKDCERACIVVAQAIPAATTINAPVVVTIGSSTQQFPLTKCDCTQATACSVRTRTRYAVRVETTPTGGIFKLLGRICCAPNNNLRCIGSAPVTPGAANGGD